MNPFEIFKNINIDEFKKKTEETINGLKEIVVTGESGGGFVKVKLNGEFKILSIEFEENDIIKNDLITFRDLIISAHNDAVIKIKEEIQKKFSSTIIPGLF